MSVLSILTWPDPRLSEVCAAIESEDVHDLAHAMLETMYAAPGRGLAAPQVGVMRRLFVMDTTWKEGRPDPQVFINPEILEASETLVESEEGCLSIPGVKARVARPDRVHMVWTALDGARVSQVFTGFAAACVQHEMDHLNGIVTLDRVSPEDRAVIEETYAV